MYCISCGKQLIQCQCMGWELKVVKLSEEVDRLTKLCEELQGELVKVSQDDSQKVDETDMHCADCGKRVGDSGICKCPIPVLEENVTEDINILIKENKKLKEHIEELSNKATSLRVELTQARTAFNELTKVKGVSARESEINRSIDTVLKECEKLRVELKEQTTLRHANEKRWLEERRENEILRYKLQELQDCNEEVQELRIQIDNWKCNFSRVSGQYDKLVNTVKLLTKEKAEVENAIKVLSNVFGVVKTG